MAYQLKQNEECVAVHPIGVQYRCEFCKLGHMIVTNDPVIVPMVQTNPTQPIMRRHVCDKCGKEMLLPKAYPCIEWETEDPPTTKPDDLNSSIDDLNKIGESQ